MSEAGKSVEGTRRSTGDFFVHGIPDFFAQHADAFFKDGEQAQWLREAVEQLARGTAFYVACGVVFIVPALAYGPALGMMGFSAAGPVAGEFEAGPAGAGKGAERLASCSLAAGIQSTFSPVVAGGVFATLQSAAMGGYGVGPVAALTQVGAVAATTAVGLSDHAAKGSVKDDEKED
ncbi:hypothetical protein BKA80DRAFT_254927 [Phyllosticta citrichinensis]